MSQIVKTEIVFTVLHEQGNPIEGLEEALYESTQGHAVGATTFVTHEPLPESEVESELVRLGNDGAFFEPLFPDEDE